jgi:UDP-N-acetylmuramyl pentapeptide phosphotransferase/UDP-N-acetylglucosamine-1-phosphate transferase
MRDEIGSSVAGATITAMLAAAISVTLIIVLRPWLRRYALARPNARSSHREPTPQGAGIAVIAATIVAACANVHFFAVDGTMAPSLFGIFAGAILMATVGAVDDIRPIAVLPRLLLQAMIVASVVYLLPDNLRIFAPLPWWLERCLLVLAGLWFVNLVNFMDGIDWMIVAEVVPLTASLVVLGQIHALPAYGTAVAAALGGAMIGFAYFNRPTASIFLGDVGSLPIGLLLGWLLLLIATGGHLIAAIVLPLYYLADATVTLLLRLIRGEPVWQPHRMHFYQLATDHGFTVMQIVVCVFAANIVLAALSVLTVAAPSTLSDVVALVGGAIVVACLLLAFVRGRS